MAFCPNCGAALKDGAKFCTSCGTPIVPKSAPAPAPAEPEVPVRQTWTAPAEPEAPVQQTWTAPAEPEAPVQQTWTAPAEPEAPVQQSYTAPAAKKSAPKKKKWLLPVIIGAVVLVAVIAVLLLLPGGGSGDDEICGVYSLAEVRMGGAAVDMGTAFPEGFDIELKDGGKATASIGGETGACEYIMDGTMITLTGSLNWYGTVENGVMTLENMYETGMDAVLLKPGASLPKAEAVPEATEEPAPAEAAEPTAEPEATPEATAEPAPAESPAVPADPTGSYYGWVRLSNCTGELAGSELFESATAILAQDETTGRPFFEAYLDADALLSMFVTVDGAGFAPSIGTEDAWILDLYLEAADASAFRMDPATGLFTCTYAYDDGTSTALVEMAFRMYGQLWDEAADTLPPDYADYKTEIGF